MAYRFTDPVSYPYRVDRLFLGKAKDGRQVGAKLERHALVVAGSGAGKGVGFIVQNARKWAGPLLLLDPKEGENLELTWRAREALGQNVYAIDPLRVANIPPRLRASFNPLAEVDPADIKAGAALSAIGDGLIVNHNPEHMEWTETARTILAGLCAYIVQAFAPEDRNFSTLRALITQPHQLEDANGTPILDADGNTQGLWATAQKMAAYTSCGGLTLAASKSIATGVTNNRSVAAGALELAERATAWLDDEAIASCLNTSTFSLSELKAGTASVYVVLHPDYLTKTAALMRLFVQCALTAMKKSKGEGAGCLFILDEFYTLGKIEQIQSQIGILRHYGVHICPILQSLGQLFELYKPEGAQSFFTNSDALIFFGNEGDQLGLEYISRRLGPMTPDEAGAFPPEVEAFDPIPQPRPAPFVPEPPPRQSAGSVHTRAAISPPHIAPLSPEGGGATMFFTAFSNGVAQSRHDAHVAADNSAAARVEMANREQAAHEANDRADWQNRNARAEAVHRAAEEERMRVWQRDNALAQEQHNARQKARQMSYDHSMRSAFQPRLTPHEIEYLTGKPEGRNIARSMIVFAKAGDVMNLKLYPYFEEDEFLKPYMPKKCKAWHEGDPAYKVGRSSTFKGLPMNFIKP